MTKKPTVAIIIPAYNEQDVIWNCLKSCVTQTAPAHEIIVVNNNSHDKTVAIVERFQKIHPAASVRLVTEHTQGLIAARNRGFKEAKSDILGRIDADSMIHKSWVEAVGRTFSNNKIAAASGPVTYHDMPLPQVSFKVDEILRRSLHKYAIDHRFLFGSNMAIRKSVWEKVARLTHEDPKDEFHEDIDIALTLFENNFEVVYDSAMIGSMSARRLEDNPRDFYNYVMRFERTFKVHEVKSRRARLPIVIYLLIYFPIRTIRKFYDAKKRRFTLQKIRETN